MGLQGGRNLKREALIMRVQKGGLWVVWVDREGFEDAEFHTEMAEAIARVSLLLSEGLDFRIEHGA